MNYETILAFFLADLALCLSPGPATMVTASHAYSGGMKNAIGPILGIHVGNFIWYALSGFGLIALIQTAPNIYEAIRWIGVIYLLWIGYQIYSSKSKNFNLKSKTLYNISRGFLSGLMVHLSNPKALLFYAAILPPFINPDGNITLQIIILAAITLITESIGLLFYSFAAIQIRNRAEIGEARLSILADNAEKIAGAALFIVAIAMGWLNYSNI